jgi:site-specific DNA-cytosine methylase
MQKNFSINKDFSFENIKRTETPPLESYIDFNFEHQPTDAEVFLWHLENNLKAGYKKFIFDFAQGRKFNGGTLTAKEDVCRTLLTSLRYAKVRVNDDGSVEYAKLSPYDSFRLQGFTNEDCDKALSVSPKTQVHTQAGNSITVNVLESIFKELIKE